MTNKEVINFMQGQLAINNLALIIDRFDKFVENPNDDVTLYIDDFIDNKHVKIKVGLFGFNSVVITSRLFSCEFRTDGNTFKRRFKHVFMMMIEDLVND